MHKKNECFECVVCKKIFTLQQSLKRHRSNHLLSISVHFSRRGCEVRSQVPIYVSKFGIVGRELPTELPNFETNFRSSIDTWCDICNGVRGLTDGFLRNIEQKIGKESYKIITNTLRDNSTSRLSLKLLDPENLDRRYICQK